MEQSHAFPQTPWSWGAFVAPLLLSLLMSAIVSAISLVRSQCFDAHVLDLWPGAWLTSFVIALPILLLAMPVVRWLTARVTARSDGRFVADRDHGGIGLDSLISQRL